MRIRGLWKQEKGAKDNQGEGMIQRRVKNVATYAQKIQKTTCYISSFYNHKSVRLLLTISSVIIALKAKCFKKTTLHINIFPRVASCRPDKINNVARSQSHLYLFHGWVEAMTIFGFLLKEAM